MFKDRPQLAAPSQIVLVGLYFLPMSVQDVNLTYVKQPKADLQIAVHCFAKSVRLIYAYS